MRIILTKFLFLIILLENNFAQTSIEEVYSLANKLFENKNYFDAITEYKRVNYFDTKKEILLLI